MWLNLIYDSCPMDPVIPSEPAPKDASKEKTTPSIITQYEHDFIVLELPMLGIVLLRGSMTLVVIKKSLPLSQLLI